MRVIFLLISPQCLYQAQTGIAFLPLGGIPLKILSFAAASYLALPDGLRASAVRKRKLPDWGINRHLRESHRL
jgi:hypothetical protein